MLEIGKYNTLQVARKVDFGLYLASDTDEVLLPKKYVTPEMEIGSDAEVFIYKDSEDRTIATTLRPYATVGDFVFLKAKDVTAHGAFLDWGLEKDLFVPFREQENKMEVGRSYVVYIYLDKLTKRLAASAKVNRYLSSEIASLQENEKVELLLHKKTDLGFGAIINNQFQGLIYKNEIFSEIKVGDKIHGWIKTIREDGKIDLRLQPVGIELSDDAQKTIWNKLTAKNGFLALTDNSEPQLIMQELSMSKKTFKKAVGGLFKDKKIVIEKDGIRLV